VADALLRDLQREAQRDPSARVAYLRARLRADERCGECSGRGRWLGPERQTVGYVECVACAGTGLLWLPRIELAAYVGDQAARDTIEPMRGAWVRNKLPEWARGLARWGRMVCVRAAVAGARVALPESERGLVHRDGSPICGDEYYLRPRRAIEAAEAWTVCPCEKHAREAWAAQFDRTALPPWASTPAYMAASDSGNPDWGSGAAGALEDAARLAGEDRVRAAVLSEVAPFALGERDVVAERVRERERPLPESCPACGRFGDPPVDEDGEPVFMGTPCEACGV
jgi:hypothetical protein